MDVITGGAGFIGSTLALRLLSQGRSVVVLDDLSSGDAANVPPQAKFIRASAGQIGAHGLQGVEHVYHLGIGSSSPMYRQNHPLTGKMIEEFCQVADFCVAQNAKLVFASTSSLYSGATGPQSEDALLRPTDLYTEARFSMERLAEVYAQIYGLQWAGLRLFSVYGEREAHKKGYANLITQFIWDAQAGRPIRIFGDGEQTRDFTHADDVCMAFDLAMQKGNGVYNVGTGQSYTINAMVDLLQDEMGRPLAVERVPNPIRNYVQATKAETSKAEEGIGFKSSISLREGIRRSIKHYTKK